MSYEEPSEWDEICDLCNKWGLHSEEACKELTKKNENIKHS